MFLNDVVRGLDRKLKYVVSKMFTLKKIKRDEELVLEASPRNHIGVIKSGRFKIKKAIGLGVIKKYKV